MDVPTIVIAVVAVIISAYSLYYSILTRIDAARAQAIHDFYSIFHEFDKLHLENWQLSHLFVTPDQYASVEKQVADRKNFTNEERIEYALKERAIAYFIFDTYEHTLYQWRQAKQGKDKGRAGFLLEVLNFLTSKTLRNPRLLYLWSKETGNYESATLEHYVMNVTNDPDDPLTYEPDPGGPFAITDSESAKVGS
jgi:hypothetical protein